MATRSEAADTRKIAGDLRKRERRIKAAADRKRSFQTFSFVVVCGVIGFLFLWASPLFRESNMKWFVGDRNIAGRSVDYRNTDGGCWRLVRHEEDLVRRDRVGTFCGETPSGVRYLTSPTGLSNEWVGRQGDEFFGRWWRGT